MRGLLFCKKVGVWYAVKMVAEDKVDVNYCFYDDTHECDSKEKFNREGTLSDPDTSCSLTLRHYHKLLWGNHRKLPNGEVLDLVERDYNKGYLVWHNIWFSSDYLTNSYSYWQRPKNVKVEGRPIADVVREVKEQKGKKWFNGFIFDYVRATRTIGGEIIFPRANSINVARGGGNQRIRDRFDLTLECIRRYYQGGESPLSAVFNQKENQTFFDLFIEGDKTDVNNRKQGFENYVRYFYLDDWVSEDYQTIKYLIMDEVYQDDPFKTINGKDYNPLPQNPENYIKFVEKQIERVKLRNQRIANAQKDGK